MSGLALFSENCPIAKKARKSNKVARWLLKNTGRKICPFCKAYERKYGIPAYEQKANEAEFDTREDNVVPYLWAYVQNRMIMHKCS